MGSKFISRAVALRIVAFSYCILSGFIAPAQGHFVGSSFNPNDYFIPSASGWVFALYYSYSRTDYHNGNGNKTDLIELSQSPPLSIEVSQTVKTTSIVPMAIYFGKGKVLNANWGFLALPIINSPTANIALDFYTGQNSPAGGDINIKTFGLGDFYVQPLWLTWEKGKLTTATSYGLWLPTGKYKANGTENVGLGYFSHNFRVASRYKLNSKFTFTGAATFETNSGQRDVDFHEAAHLTFDYGATYYFPKGHEIGLMGFGGWQLGSDKGEKAVLNKDKLYGIGVYGSYWLTPGKLGILVRLNQNFGVRNRFGGLSFQAGINYLLLRY